MRSGVLIIQCLCGNTFEIPQGKTECSWCYRVFYKDGDSLRVKKRQISDSEYHKRYYKNNKERLDALNKLSKKCKK